MKRLARISATVASTAFLVAGVAGVAGASPLISGNGNNSTSDVTQTADWTNDAVNDATVNAQNNNPQSATSGTALADDNTDAGDLETGAAGNTSVTEGTVDVDYSSANATALGGGGFGGLGDVASPEISDNGNNTSNTVTQHATVSNAVNNNASVTVQNNNSQSATTGNATATNNNTAGSVTTGAATNSSTTTFSVSVKY